MARRKADTARSRRIESGLSSRDWVTAPSHVRRALLSPTIANLFQTLDVGLTVWEPGRWRDVYDRPHSTQILRLELEHGVEAERAAYNIRCLAEAGRSRRSVVAEQSGYTDFFVPVCSGRRAHAVLVSGPIATARPTSEAVRARWRKLSQREADPSDPEFFHYLTATLSTLVLEGELTTTFRLLLEKIARLMASEGALERTLQEIEALGEELAQARLPERMWAVAHDLVDEKTGRSWASRNLRPRLMQTGIEDLPERLLVGLFVDREPTSDRVDDALRRDAFQRRLVALVRKKGDCAGRLGDYGISLMIGSRGPKERSRRALLDLGEQVAKIARQDFGFELHVGIAKNAGPLVEQYPIALACAELALSKGVRVVEASADAVSGRPLGPLRRELAELTQKKPSELAAQFDRYIEAVTARSQGRLEVAAAHLEAGFDSVSDSVRDAGVLEAKNLTSMHQGLERAATDAGDLSELFAVYRRAIRDLVETIVAPRKAHRERSLGRAEEYIRKHFAERLALKTVARVAGFTPSYFSDRFHKKLGVTFEEFVTNLRIQHARQLLSGTSMSVRRVAELSGFGSPEYLARVFKRAMGESPLAHRERTRAEGEMTADPIFPVS
jgi:AraC-like DNA-binding protein